MLKHLFRPIISRVSMFQNIRLLSQWHRVPKFYTSEEKNFHNYENNLRQLEQATQQANSKKQQMEASITLINYLKGFLTSYLNHNNFFTFRYFSCINQMAYTLFRAFAFLHFSNKNQYFQIAESYFDQNSISLLDNVYEDEFIKIQKQNQLTLKLIIEGANLELANLHSQINDIFDIFETIDYDEEIQQFRVVIQECILKKIIFFFVVSRIYQQRGDISEQERFFEEGLIELKKQFLIAQKINATQLKQYLFQLANDVAFSLLSFSGKKVSQNFIKFIQHLYEIAKIFDDINFKNQITFLHIDYLIISQQHVSTEFLLQLKDDIAEEERSNKEIFVTLCVRVSFMDRGRGGSLMELIMTQPVYDWEMDQSEFTQLNHIYFLMKFSEEALINELKKQNITYYNDRISLIQKYLMIQIDSSFGNIPDCDSLNVILAEILKLRDLPQKEKLLVLNKLYNTFLSLQPRIFNGSKQELENQYCLTLLQFMLWKQENLSQQVCFQEYKKFILHFMKLEHLCNQFFPRLIEINFQILQEKEFANELKNYINQAIQRVKQLKNLENKDQILQLLESQLNKAKRLINQNKK